MHWHSFFNFTQLNKAQSKVTNCHQRRYNIKSIWTSIVCITQVFSHRFTYSVDQGLTKIIIDFNTTKHLMAINHPQAYPFYHVIRKNALHHVDHQCFTDCLMLFLSQCVPAICVGELGSKRQSHQFNQSVTLSSRDRTRKATTRKAEDVH